MDTYSEQLVKKTETSSDTMKRIMILTGGAVAVTGLLFLAIMYSMFILFAAALVIFAVYWFITGTNVEYEYTVTNSDLDIDKIISQRKRVGLISVNIKEITDFGVYCEQPFNGTTVYAAGGDEQVMFADFNTDNYGQTRLVFSPDQKTLENIKIHLQRSIKVKLKGE